MKATAICQCWRRCVWRWCLWFMGACWFHAFEEGEEGEQNPEGWGAAG